MKDFTWTLAIPASEENIYAALTQSIPEWWTEMFEGNAQRPGQTFTIAFGPTVYKTLLVEELVPHNKVAWRVVDALIDLPELRNKKEWIDTQIVWEIYGGSGGTLVKLSHLGLTPAAECYEICASGWQNFLQSFEKFIRIGLGSPFRMTEAQLKEEPI